MSQARWQRGGGPSGGPDAGAEPSDGGGDAFVATEGGAGCDPNKPFGSPELVPNVNLPAGRNVETGSLSPDGLVLYLSGDGPGNGNKDVFTASRASLADEFGALASLGALADGAKSELRASITADKTKLYVSSNITSTSLDITFLTGVDGGSFGAPKNVAGINSSNAEIDPFILPYGKVLYFARNNGVAGSLLRTDLGAAAPTNVHASSATERSPVVTPDERVMYYARVDGVALNYDIYVATANPPGNFGDGTLVSELQTVTDEMPIGLTPDRCTLYFVSKRTVGSDVRVWRATRGR